MARSSLASYLADLMAGSETAPGEASDVFSGLASASALALNACSAAKVALARGQDAGLLFWGDSTSRKYGDGISVRRDWPYLFADRFAAENPGFGVEAYPWDDLAGNSSIAYQPKIVIQAATGSNPTLRIYVAAVAGSTPQYFMGESWFTALGAPALDGLIIAHGHNLVGSVDESVVRGEIIAAIEQFKLYHPSVPITWKCQNPRRDDTQLTPIVEQIKRIAQLRDVAILDAHSAWLAAGLKSQPSYYEDNVHPAQPGQNFDGDLFWQHWLQAAPLLPPARSSLFSYPVAPGVNLASNGDFRSYPASPGLPTGWTSSGSGSQVVTKDTGSIYPVADPRQGYTVNITDPTSSGYITQGLSSTIYTPLRGHRVTMAVKKYLDVTGDASPNTTLARVALKVGSPTAGETVIATTRPYIVRPKGWVWWVISGLYVPEDCNQIQMYLYHDTATPGATPHSAGYDQVCLLPGWLPGAAR